MTATIRIAIKNNPGNRVFESVDEARDVACRVLALRGMKRDRVEIVRYWTDAAGCAWRVIERVR